MSPDGLPADPQNRGLRGLLAALQSRGIRLREAGGRLFYDAPDEAALTPKLRAAIAEHREALIRLLALLPAEPASAGPALRQPGDPAPASYAQERFLFIDQLEGGSAAYNLSSLFHFRGRLDIGAFQLALADLGRRHEILRTYFDLSTDPPTQLVSNALPPLLLADASCRGLATDALSPEMAAMLRAPFDLVAGPHLRAMIERRGDLHHLFAVCMHHIVSDGPSIMVFVEELKALYAARLAAAPPPPPPALQFRDVALWQRRGWTGQRMAREIAFWREELAGAPALTELPFAGRETGAAARQGSTAGVSFDFVLPDAAQSRHDTGLAADRQTFFHVALASFALLLLKHGQQSELVIGVPIANRSHAALQPVIGPLINMVPFRIGTREPASAGATLGALIAQVRETTLRLLDHADLPFERIVQALAPPRDPSHSPIVQVMFVTEDTPVGVMALPGLQVETAVIADVSAKLELTLAIQRRGGRLHGIFKARQALFDAAQLEVLARRYGLILEAMLRRPGLRVADCPVLDPTERDAALAAARGPDRAFASHLPLHRLFEASAAAHASHTAVAFEGATLTYRALDLAADRLAARLEAAGARRGQVIAIIAERSLAMILAVLGTLKSRAAYLPIDPATPAARLAGMLAAASVRLVLVQHGALPILPAGTPVLTIAEPDEPAPYADTTNRPGTPHDDPAGADMPACVFFTSGSTGQPKGVVLSHRAMANNLLWMQESWALTTSDTVLFKAAFNFDVSLKEILWPLLAGARLLVARPGGQRDPAYLHRTIEAHAVSVVHLVPSMLDHFLPNSAQAGGRLPACLRIVMCGGEALSDALKDRFCAASDAELLHLYGPTEAAIAVTASSFGASAASEPITLGRPMPNCTVHVLDADLEPVPDGSVGELHIGGLPLAHGYLGDGALTAAKFLPDPLGTQPGGRLYRTGDLARRLPDGRIRYLGRVDRQVKFRGFRIELGEIEAALRGLPGVREAIVARKTDRGVPVLAAYVVGEEGGSPAAMRAQLASVLPAYMLPDVISAIPAIPMTANGKADLAALPDPDAATRPAPAVAPALAAAAMPSGRKTTAPARAAMAALVASCWRDVLQRDHADADISFFEAGGHSLMAMRLRHRLAEATGRPVAITDIFAHPTINAFTDFLCLHAALPAPGEAPSDQHAAPSTLPAGIDEHAIAVIGMAGRFPGADTLEAFWAGLEAGRVAIHHFTADELLDAGISPDLINHPNYVRARGRIDATEAFDAGYFRFSARDAELLDPQFRLLLESCQHALDDAALDPERAREAGLRIGVFASVSRSSYFLNRIAHQPDIMERVGPQQISVSTDKSFAATHVAYRLGLLGPAMTIDTACSSSLVALHQACQSLRHGEADMMLVAAASVDVPMQSGYFYQDGNIAAPDGHCRPFDAAASGTVKGSGGGAVLLRRATDAIAAGDPIAAIIRGSAINNDGLAKMSFTAPSEAGQIRVIDAALIDAGLPAESIAFVETHGTGTELGDAIEFAALRARYGREETWLGGVKASIGHLDAAAGLAGFIKATLAVQAGRIPPLANWTAPAPALDLAGRAFRFPVRAVAWPERGPRRAAISSLGMGGTNAHVVIEQAPPLIATPPGVPPPGGASDTAGQLPLLVRLSAKTRPAMIEVALGLARHLERHDPPIAAVAHTLAQGRSVHALRSGFAAASTAALASQLHEAATSWRNETDDDASLRPASPHPAPIFLIGGHGGQHARMGRRLHATLPAFRDAADLAVAAFEAAGFTGLRGAFDPAEPEPACAARLSDHVSAQALIFVVCHAIGRALAAHGLAPSAIVGLSIGEVVGASLAGCITLDHAARLVLSRSRTLARCGGGMAQIAAGIDRVAATLPGDLDVAVAADGACVITGADAALEAALAHWTAQGVRCRRLRVEHPGHSRALEPHLAVFRDEIAALKMQPPAVPLASNVTGRWHDAQAAEPAYWASQLRQTVRLDLCLAEALGSLPADSPIIEIGPGLSMLTHARQNAAFNERPAWTTMPSASEDEDEYARFLACLGQAWSYGLTPDLPASEDVPRIRLPGYPFQRARHWIGRHQAAPNAGLAHDLPSAGLAEIQIAAPHESSQQRPGETGLRAIWKDMLGIGDAECDTDFFALGGDSLAATHLLARVHRLTGVRISLAVFFRRPTLAALETLAGAAAMIVTAPPAVEPEAATPQTATELLEF